MSSEKNGFLLRAAREGLGYFLNSIVVPAPPEPAPFGLIAEPWQHESLGPKIPAIEHLAGLSKEYAGPLRFMDILSRGHNKSSKEAWLSVWLALASRRIIHGYILAADRDQGRLIVQAAEDLLGLNDWLRGAVTIHKDTITGPGGSVSVLPCDAASSMGLRGNFYIADEITHWKRQKEWNALVSGLRKIRPTVFCVLSNAGSLGSWQHEAFETAGADPEWCVFYRPGVLASWLDRAGLDRDRRLLPPSEAARLIDNEWIDPAAEHDYLRRSELLVCEAGGESRGLRYRLRREYGVSNYVAAIDYGPRRDRTALVVLHCAPDGPVVVDRLDVWQGTPESPVQIQAVEAWVKDVQKGFCPLAWVIDPYQMESTIQWMGREGLPVEPFKSRAGQGNFELAQLLRALVVDRKLLWYPGAGQLGSETLVDELAALRVKRMSYGYRFDHETQKHDDRAVAIAMAASVAVTRGGGKLGVPVRLNQASPRDFLTAQSPS